MRFSKSLLYLTLLLGLPQTVLSQVRIPEPRRFTEHFAECVRHQLSIKPVDINSDVGLTRLRNQMTGDLQRWSWVGQACEAYAQVAIEREVGDGPTKLGAMVLDFATSDSVSKLKESVDTLGRNIGALEKRQAELSALFQKQFVDALACSFATDAAARQTACTRLPR